MNFKFNIDVPKPSGHLQLVPNFFLQPLIVETFDKLNSPNILIGDEPYLYAYDSDNLIWINCEIILAQDEQRYEDKKNPIFIKIK